MSGVSVRTLHYYDEAGILKPARTGANGYRYYEEPQLLMLQQILFYRELGFELKQIKQILERPEFEKLEALLSHRKVLLENLARTRTLIATIDKTIDHLKGKNIMKSEELFAGFSVAAGEDRFGERIQLGGEPHDCKVSARDTAGAMSIFEFTGGGGGPRHLHHDQDEWIYILEGEYQFSVGDRRFRLGPGESVFLPRGVSHAWSKLSDTPGRIIDVFQPAGKMEEFFRELGKYQGETRVHDALSLDGLKRLFQDHGMDLTGPPIAGEWKVDAAGRISQTK